ncbi:DUF3080 family protein [Vibrio methylphosphonaticus]|uniref:DUF3080 family protein n=1 Tax=Vibrio methylphosphonaticus TaxID=2946866 RepID=UPI00202A3C11|nr:DUF3080 family protein [Vibrio methylphosphonaticus]MCL9776934.1 DUF3080 domain-containing protein [Vibrio methylphosphonaticus]
MYNNLRWKMVLLPNLTSVRSIKRGALLIVSAASVFGCFQSNDQSELFSDYQSRVASVQDQPVLSVPAVGLVSLPAKRDMVRAIPVTTLGLVQTYQLRNCGLFGLVAEKNSSLGKVQDEFRFFDYQIKLIAGLEACLMSDSIDSDLKSELQTILDSKYQHLPYYFSNLVLSSDAMRSQLNSDGWLASDVSRMAIYVQPALAQLNQMSDYIIGIQAGTQISQERPESLIEYQEVLEKQRVIGNLLFSLKASSKWLNAITHQLREYDSKVVCGPGRDMTRFRYLVNVFNQIFIANVQPYLSLLNSEYRVIELDLRVIDSALLAGNHELVHYPTHDIYQQFTKATQSHVGYWKALFRRCGKTLKDVRND